MTWDQVKREIVENRLKWSVTLVAVGWLFGVGWQEFSQVDTSYYFKSTYYVSSARDKEVERKLAERICGGSFSDRYECRSNIAITNDQKVFVTWVKKFVIVGGPPLLLMGLYRLARSPNRPSAKRTKTVPPKKTTTSAPDSSPQNPGDGAAAQPGSEISSVSAQRGA